MTGPDQNPPKPTYRWPWFAAAAVVLALVLAVVWVGFAARKVASQRDFSPLPAAAPAR